MNLTARMQRANGRRQLRGNTQRTWRVVGRIRVVLSDTVQILTRSEACIEDQRKIRVLNAPMPRKELCK